MKNICLRPAFVHWMKCFTYIFQCFLFLFSTGSGTFWFCLTFWDTTKNKIKRKQCCFGQVIWFDDQYKTKIHEMLLSEHETVCMPWCYFCTLLDLTRPLGSHLWRYHPLYINTASWWWWRWRESREGRGEVGFMGCLLVRVERLDVDSLDQPSLPSLNSHHLLNRWRVPAEREGGGGGGQLGGGGGVDEPPFRLFHQGGRFTWQKVVPVVCRSDNYCKGFSSLPPRQGLINKGQSEVG